MARETSLGAATLGVDHGGQLLGERGVKLDLLALGRVDEAQVGGVQGQPRRRDLTGPIRAVDRVSQHGVAQEGEVDPDLVRSTGAELRLHDGQ